MSRLLLQPVDRPELAARPISPRLRSQLVYFTGKGEAPGAPAVGENEFFLPGDEVSRILEDGVFYLVSPLDTAHMTEVELSDEQEELLQWLQANRVQHVRVVEG